jgi:hypothetical protein
MKLGCCFVEIDLIERFSQISNIVFAGASLLLAWYVFVYQRKKDRHEKRLLWFKELVIEPNKSLVYKFFNDLPEITANLKSHNLTDLEKIQITSQVKEHSARFRRDFIVLLGAVDRNLEKDVLAYIDGMNDELIRVVFDPNLTLSDSVEYEKHVELKIYSCRSNLFSRIFNYGGEESIGYKLRRFFLFRSGSK